MKLMHGLKYIQKASIKVPNFEEIEEYYKLS